MVYLEYAASAEPRGVGYLPGVSNLLYSVLTHLDLSYMEIKTISCSAYFRLFITLLLAAGLAPGAANSDGKSPVDVLRGISDHVMEIIKKDPSVLDDKARLRDIAEQFVLPHVDFIALSQAVLGINWRKATPEQRQVFEQEFRTLLMNTYLSSISRADYHGQSIRYLPMRKPPTGDLAEVDAEIEQPNGPLIHAQFRMYRRDGGEWKIYDVVAEGVSLVVTQRSSFSSIIRDKGLDGLIAMLVKRNRDHADPALPDQVPATPR
jgi:phospholipid transport system substrate-binding protein